MQIMQGNSNTLVEKTCPNQQKFDIKVLNFCVN